MGTVRAHTTKVPQKTSSRAREERSAKGKPIRLSQKEIDLKKKGKLSLKLFRQLIEAKGAYKKVFDDYALRGIKVNMPRVTKRRVKKFLRDNGLSNLKITPQLQKNLLDHLYGTQTQAGGVI